MSVWIFGYGSLVAPESLASTIGRRITIDTGMHVVELTGYGRRWNYGSKALRGDWTDEGGTDVIGGLVVSLGVVEALHESTNGVIFEVNDTELAELDRRESGYERVDVTDQISLIGESADQPLGSIATYVPRASSIVRYELHRDAGTAAIRRSYWHLVDAAFAALGADHLDWYRRTPAPDVPVCDIVLDRLTSIEARPPT